MDDFVVVPEWIEKLKKTQNFNYWRNTQQWQSYTWKISLNTLVLNGISLKDKKNILCSIKSINGLIYLVHDNCLDLEDISYLKIKNPAIKILNKQDYELKIKNGEITCHNRSYLYRRSSNMIKKSNCCSIIHRFIF